MYIDGKNTATMDSTAITALETTLSGLNTSPTPQGDSLLAFIWGGPNTTAGDAGSGVIALETPTFDTSSVAELLNLMQNKVNNLRLATAGEQIQTSQAQRENYNKRALEQLDELIKKALEAIDKQKQTDTLDMVKAVFEVIGAVLAFALSVVATAASVGAAAASMIGAGIGLTMALMDLANEIQKTQKVQVIGPDGKKEALDISVGGMVKAIVDTQIAEGTIKFSSEKEKNDYITGWTITANIIIMIISIASGIPGLKNCAGLAKDAIKGVTEALDKINQTGKLAEIVARGLSAIMDISQGAATAAHGVFTIQLAKIRADSDAARNLKTLLDAYADVMSQFISSQSDEIKNVSNEMVDTLKSTTEMMASSSDTQIEVAHNFS